MEIQELLQRQREFFASGATRSAKYRMQALERLRQTILGQEKRILAALKEDLNKSEFEGYMSEVGIVLDEIRYQLRHIKKWVKPKRVKTPLAQFCSAGFQVAEPYGVTLVISPWNYPFQLSLAPLVGAVAAGNCVLVKPSAYAPATSQIVSEIVSACFPQGHAAVVQGGREKNKLLLQQRFDYIFFTGGTSVGRLVMESAAQHLTPVSLELGGKSPCIIDQTADLKLAAKRVAFGKALNCGQTCVAPDYLLIHRQVKEVFIGHLQEALRDFLGEAPLENPNYPRMVNEKHFDRVCGLMAGEKIRWGGGNCRETLKIEPTILDEVSPESPVMGQEIFGPLLPVLSFDSLEEAVSFVNARPKPLACYLFTTDKKAEKMVLEQVSFGGGCINDTIIHLATSEMGFGGVGESGMGSYHGKSSFDTFSHYKSIVKKANFIDLPMRYHPYTSFHEKLVRLFLR